jgi:uncharacterized protein YjbI with pentapeptide repeats
VKIIKPELLSLLSRPLLFRGRQRLSVTALAGFALDGEARRLWPENQLWPVLGQATGGVWDEGLPKADSEVLLFGSCYNEGGRPLPVSSVRLQLGAVDKRVAVIGDRIWEERGGFTDPEPFTSMPLIWERAFGGPSWKRNPKGKGAERVSIEAGKRVLPLPNLELPGKLLTSASQRPDPVGFGPIDLTWPQRAAAAGTYDDGYLERHFPGFPPDLKPEFFQLAPPDQRIEGYFRGDEPYLLENLHPGRARLAGRLPAIRARCFARRRGGVHLEAIDMRLETVVFLPDHELGVLVFRGVVDIVEDDAADLDGLFAACEAHDEPRPDEHYQEAFDRRLDKDASLLLALDERDLCPAFAVSSGLAEASAGARDGGFGDKLLLRIQHQLAAEGERLETAAALSAPALPSLDDPAALAAFEEQTFASLEKAAAEMQAELDAERAGAAEAGAPRSRNGAVGPPLPIADEILAELAAAGQATSGVEAKLRELDVRMRALYRQSAHQQAPAAPLGAELSALRRAVVLERHAGGEDLAEIELTGCDLTSAALPGARLPGAFLGGADLTSTDLTGADLAGAVLAYAELAGASLAGSRCDGANLGGARLEGTRLDSANLRAVVLDDARIRATSFANADLTDASFAGATLEDVSFEGALAPELTFQDVDLASCRFAAAKLSKANFLETALTGVDFSNAELELVTFMGVDADRACFAGARLRGLHAVAGCSFAGADFRGADLEGAFLRGANLEGADLTDARLAGADLSECNLRGARLTRVQATNTSFVRADLTGADLREANLMNALLQKAQLAGADLSGANLFASNLGQVRLDEATKLTGCNLKRVLVHPLWTPHDPPGAA